MAERDLCTRIWQVVLRARKEIKTTDTDLRKSLAWVRPAFDRRLARFPSKLQRQSQTESYGCINPSWVHQLTVPPSSHLLLERLTKTKLGAEENIFAVE